MGNEQRKPLLVKKMEEYEYNPIKELRQKLKISQAKFAFELFIPLRTVQSWELGERHCPDYVIRLINYYFSHGRGDL